MTERIVGHYRIVEQIGGGGMGVVYKAMDVRLGRPVALKFLAPELTANADARQRFLNEARAASVLDHPNICTVYDTGETPRGDIWIAMALCEGETLKDEIDRGPLTPARAVSIIEQLASALHKAHGAGVIHRDVKPGNVMLSSDGVARLLDFGLAKFGTTTITRTGTTVGTAAYMSPEQIRAIEPRPASDMWSLGVLFFEMLTGHRPFVGDVDPAVLYSVLHDEPPLASTLREGIPPHLDAVIMKMLRKEPSERFGSMLELLGRLRSLSNGSVTAHLPLLDPKRRAGAYAAAAIVLLLLASASALLVQRNRSIATMSSETAAPRQEVVQLAVLPFSAVGGKAEDQRLAEGLSEAVAARVGSIGDLQVITPGSDRIPGENRNIQYVARSLGANYVLRGVMLRSADRIRITWSIIDPATSRQVAGNSLDGTNADLFGFEDRLAEQLLQSLTIPLLRRAAPRPESALLSANAQDRYFQAIGFLQRYEDESSVDRAIEMLDSLHASAPQSALIAAALGRAHLYKYLLTHEPKWASSAEDICRRAAKIDPSLPEVRITTGEIYTLTGRYDEAIRDFNSVLKDRPNSPEATLGLASAYDFSKQEEKAEKTYKAAISLRPVYWAGYNKLGAFYLRRGRVDEAQAMFRKVIELTPDNMRGHSNLAAALMTAGRFADAVGPLERSIAIRPNSSAFSNLGTSLYMTGRFDDAARAFEEAVVLTPAEPVLWYNLGDAYRWSTNNRSKANDAYAKAIRLSRDALRITPSDIRLSGTVAVAQAKRGEIKIARAAMARCLAGQRDDPDTLYHAALVEAIAGDHEKALAYAASAVQHGYSSVLIKQDPEFKALNGDPRFNKLGS